MLPKTNKTATPTKIAKVDKTAMIANTDIVAKTTKTAKPVKVAKTAKSVKIAKVAKKAKTDVTNLKRLSSGQRIHERRMKQAARKEGTVYHSLVIRRAQAKKTGK